MRIEDQINTLRRDYTYLKIKSNLGYLETKRFGKGTVSVVSPDNVDNSLQIMNNSELMRETIARYREILEDFDVKMDDLHTEKARLQEQLFR
jgi:hypothetical protein